MENGTTNGVKILNLASDAEKEFFLTVLCTLANIDNKFQQEEIEYIERIAAEMNTELKPSYFNRKADSCLQNVAVISNRRLALELLKHMLTLAYTDNTFSDSEGHFICSIADALKIEPEKVSEISSWIIDRIIWLEQAAVIFEETCVPEGENND